MKRPKNIYVRGFIDMAVEEMQKASLFKTSLENILENYTIQDNVFIYNDGKAEEATSGYFANMNEYDTLTEALKHYNINTDGIRIINNRKFQVGPWAMTMDDISQVSEGCKSILSITC